MHGVFEDRAVVGLVDDLEADAFPAKVRREREA